MSNTDVFPSNSKPLNGFKLVFYEVERRAEFDFIHRSVA